MSEVWQFLLYMAYLVVALTPFVLFSRWVRRRMRKGRWSEPPGLGFYYNAPPPPKIDKPPHFPDMDPPRF